MSNEDQSKQAEAERTKHENERAQSHKSEVKSPGSGGPGCFDDAASANAKNAGKADAQAERSQSEKAAETAKKAKDGVKP
jgi:hypothetical protein